MYSYHTFFIQAFISIHYVIIIFSEKSDFQWEGAGQQLFVSKSNDTLDKSKSSVVGDAENSVGAAAVEEEYDPYYEPIVPLPDKIVVTTGEEDEVRFI